MSVEQVPNASYQVSYNDTGADVAEVLLLEEHENNELPGKHLHSYYFATILSSFIFTDNLLTNLYMYFYS